MDRKLIPIPAVVRPAEDLATLAASINAEHATVERLTSKSRELARSIGEKLLQAKAACKRGEWLLWLKDNVKCSQQRASQYMQFAKLLVTSSLTPEGEEKEWQRIQGNEPKPVAPLPEPDEPCDHRADDDNGDEEGPGLFGDDDEEERPDRVTVQSLRELAQEAADNQDYDSAQEHADEADEIARQLDEIEEPPAVPEVTGQKPYITLVEWNKLGKRARDEALSAIGQAKFNSQGDNENIEWALWSWNPVTGCLHDCPYCYARDIAERFYDQKFAPSLWPGRLKAPQNTPFPAARAAEWMGHKNVFVCSMADLFGRWVPKEWIDAVLAEVRAAPQWNFLFLTKFPIRMAEFDFPGNAWVGTTVDCQARVANAEKAFRKVKAGVKWLSIEPMIEPLKFADLGAFQWVVLGGSSRSAKTPEWQPPVEWVADLKCAADKAGVPLYYKANLWRRLRGYPGSPAEDPQKAPAELRYLPEVEART